MADIHIGARAATLEKIRSEVAPNFVDPVPTAETLRDWFDGAGIPRFKANPTAKRGGGPCFYQLSAVEKFFRTRTLPGGVMARIRGPVGPVMG
jgi:hypothetical protein